MSLLAHARANLSTPAARTDDLGRPASLSSAGVLALEGGTVFTGLMHGAIVAAEGELVFTTAATGWGEILTDPSYAGQIVVLTHPMAGNYRIAASDLESDRVHARGLVVTRLVEPPIGPGTSLESSPPRVASRSSRASTPARSRSSCETVRPVEP